MATWVGNLLNVSLYIFNFISQRSKTGKKKRNQKRREKKTNFRYSKSNCFIIKQPPTYITVLRRKEINKNYKTQHNNINEILF